MFAESTDWLWWGALGSNIVSSALLGGFVLRWRYLLLKPSIIFIAYYQLSVMWPATSWIGYITEYVTDPTEYLIAIHGFGLGATLVSVLTWHETAVKIRNRIGSTENPIVKVRFDELAICASLFAFVTIWYLSTVGWRNTGLFAILSGAEDNSETREKSLKLISSNALRYAWSFTSYAISYILAYLLAAEGLKALRRPNYPKTAFYVLGYCGVLLVVMLPGARAPAAMVVLTTLFSYYVSMGFKSSPARLVLVVGVALIAPALLSLLREQQPLNLTNLWIYYLDILDRVAGRSIEDNIWMVAYVQEHGFFGHSGFPVMARIFSEESVNIFNIVGLHFRPDGIQSVSANTSFPAANYACYGLNSIGVSLLLTFCIDGILYLNSGLPRRLLIPCSGICCIIAMNFAMTMYTTVFITHGLIITVICCYIIHATGIILRPFNQIRNSTDQS